MSNPTPGRQQYNRRKSPEQYDRGFFDTEFQNIQRAIQRPFARTVTSADTVSATDDLICCDATTAGFTETLPSPERVQFLRVTIKKVDASAHVVTIGGTVDGVVNPTLAAQYKSITVQSDGTQWLKLASV